MPHPLLIQNWARPTRPIRQVYLAKLRLAVPIFIAFCCASCRQSPTIPATVVGASMAPTIFGDHWHAECVDCKFPFQFCATELTSSNPVASGSSFPHDIVCPNCGYHNKQLNHCRLEKAGPVSVHPTAKISRWDVVAFKMPHGKSAGIKRAVGLPHESISIRNGDLFNQSSILRKPIEIQKQVRVPVYDSQFQPASNVAGRWRPNRVNGRNTDWSIAPMKFLFGPPPGNSRQTVTDQMDCLVYHHWRCCSQLGPRDQDFPIEDIDYFNQGLARELNPTDDLWMDIELEKSDDAVFGWRFYHGPLLHEFVFDCQAYILTKRTIAADQTVLESWSSALPELSSQTLKVEFSSFDAQLLVLLNGKTVFESQTDPVYQSVAKCPLEIVASHGKLSINRIRIWRDIFYLPASASDSFLVAAADQYVLLGDNVPVSIDSRHWNSAGIDRVAIIGIVKMAHKNQR